jgi:hypothetical protein
MIRKLDNDIIPHNDIVHHNETCEELSACLAVEDFVGLIFNSFVMKGDFKSIRNFGRTNRIAYKTIESLIEKLVLLPALPGLTILDAEVQGEIENDEATIDKLKLHKSYLRAASFIESNAGASFTTMFKGLTLNKLVAIAEHANIKITDLSWNNCFAEIGDIPVGRTYRKLISNKILNDTRKRNLESLDAFLLKIGCSSPTIQELLALCIFQKILYGKDLYIEERGLYGLTSTCDKIGLRYVVGSSKPNEIFISNYEHNNNCFGAVGSWILED